MNQARAGMQPLVTIIVRSMARPSLGDALSSIVAQDYSRVEVVIVAASGPDHPAPPATAGMHPVRLVVSEHQLSRPRAANAGLDASSGEWITFLDDDDILLPAHVSGLVAAQRIAGDAKVVYGMANIRLADGSSKRFGKPFAMLELYERNFISLSMSLISRDLLKLGCRFDESFDILEDWDFFLQCAQHTRFHFVARPIYEWYPESGTSRTWHGTGEDEARMAAYRDRIHAKWARAHDALVDRVEPALQQAMALAKAGQLASAEAVCNKLLDYSQNDPFALNLLSMVQRSAGRIDEARRNQELACAIRPDDASLAYNLALLCRAQGDHAAARRHCERAMRGTSPSEAARRLLAELPS